MLLNQRQLILDEFTEILLHRDLICLVFKLEIHLEDTLKT